MKILIVDDDNDKISQIVELFRSISENIKIDSSINSINAKQKLTNIKYDILILDLLLPNRIGDKPNIANSSNLVNEITRNHKVIPPNYIIGLTQYKEYINKFSDIWITVLYERNSTEWKNILKKFFNYIIKANSFPVNTDLSLIPTIYVEGESDSKLLNEAICTFEPSLNKKVNIICDKSAGASWVARQLIIWAYSLPKIKEKYIKALGILDGDKAGNDAINEIKRVVKQKSSGVKVIKTLTLSPSYAKELIPLYKNGLKIPIEIEHLLSSETWKYADNMGWLEENQEVDQFLNDPRDWNKFDHTLTEHINSLSLTNSEKIYLKRFKFGKKEKFTKHVLQLSEELKVNALKNFKPLIETIKNELSLS